MQLMTGIIIDQFLHIKINDFAIKDVNRACISLQITTFSVLSVELGNLFSIAAKSNLLHGALQLLISFYNKHNEFSCNRRAWKKYAVIGFLLVLVLKVSG